MDLISVIVPVYNVQQYLGKCIESILFQTYKNIELILVDDGSSDGSSEICDKYKDLDNRVKVYHISNVGVSAARNIGIKNATGKYIGFVDGDDWIEPRMYETMIMHLSKRDAQMCVTTKYFRDSVEVNNSKINKTILTGSQGFMHLLEYNFPTSLGSCLYKKESIKRIYLNEEVHHLEDLDFQFKVLEVIERVAICNEPFYNYRAREGSANNSGFNKKVLSCLNIIPQTNKIIYRNKNINDKYIFLVMSRLVLTISIIMTKYDYHDHKLERMITKNAQEAWWVTVLSNIPIKKKITISLLAIDYVVFSFFYSKFKL